MSSESELKRFLFDAYGGFSDRRIKNLEKSSTFIVDDRERTDFAADKSLYPWFCTMFAVVEGPETVDVVLRGNVPMSTGILAWIEERGHAWQDGRQASLSVAVPLGHEAVLEELAGMIEDITRPGAHRYEVPSYRYVCPRVARCLRTLAAHLRDYRTRSISA